MLRMVINRLDRAISFASRIAGSVGSAFIVVMMVITATDVILRYFFNRPIPGTFELQADLMVVCVAFTLAHCAIHKGHVRVEFFVSFFPERVQSVIRSIVTVLGFGLFSLITWQAVIQAGTLRASGAETQTLGIPDFPFVWVLFIGSLLISLVFLRDLVESVAQSVKGRRWTAIWLSSGSVVVLLICVVIFFGQELPWHLSPALSGLVGLGLLIILLFSGLQVGLVMGLLGFLGMAYLNSTNAALGVLSTSPFSTVASYNLSIVPLFLLMGAFAFHSGLSQDLYWACYKWLGRLPGGLAMATVFACAGFAAISGSSVATAATMGTVALPEMKRFKYDSKLATGAVAAGGTIGILIPPSVILVIYGILTDQSIGKLFLAGFIPGVLEAIFYVVTIYILCKRNPLLGPPGGESSWGEKFIGLKNTWGVLALFLLVIGGIYFGIFSPTEAAGIGAMGALLFALGRRKLNWQNFTSSVMEAGKTTAMAFLILIGAFILGYFLAVSRLPFTLAEFAAGLEVNRYIILGVMLLIYLVLGCFMAAMAMIILTVPIFFPVVVALGFDPIWFGIIIVRVVEMAAITPPVGINVYIVSGVAKDVPLQDIFRGIFPFLIADLFHIALLISVPQIALFLPGFMQ